MLGSAGSIVPKRWILGIFALGLIAVMVATSANPWAGAATLPTSPTASAISSTSIQVNWTAVDSGSTVPGSGVVDAYRVDCVGTPGTVSKTVSGIGTATATVTGLTANTAYVCSVFASSTGTLPSTGVAAASVTTPLSAAATMGSAVASLDSANVQVGGTIQITVTAKGSDSSKTVITDGFTVAWSSTSNGSVSPTTGTGTTYTASAAGSATITVTVTQTSTSIVKSDTVAVTNFTVAADPVPEPVVPITADEETVLDEAIIEIFTGLEISISDSNADGDVVSATKEAVVSISNADTVDTGDSESADLNIPAGATGSTGVAVTAVQEVFDTSTRDEPTETQGTRIGTSAVTIELRDKDGNKFGSALGSDATVTLSIPITVAQTANVDTQSLTLYKSKDGKAPWTKLTSTVTIVDGVVKVTGKTRNFSVFIIVSEPREIGVPGTAGAGAILPSAGDVAPTTTQALLVTGLGLLLIVGGGVYVRRQRRANGTV